MKKEIKRKNIFLWAIFLLIFLQISFVSAQDAFSDTEFYKKVSPYVVPVGMSGIQGFIIGVISLVIIIAVFLDIITLATPFSKATSWIIAIGLSMIMVAFQWNVTGAGWAFGVSSAIFGWVGTVAVIGNLVLGILALLAIFFGFEWLTTYLQNIKIRRENIRGIGKAKRKGGKIAALAAEAEEAGSGR